MAGRTFAIGDVHGDLDALETLLKRLPPLDADDTLVFLGDYVDRGPHSAAVVELVRHGLAARVPARVVALRGNHEDAWLRVIDEGWPGFVMPPGNGCRECLRSFAPGLDPEEEIEQLFSGAFFPPDVVAWMRSLPYWYEDAHAIYVHAGLPNQRGRWLHPSEVSDPLVLLWMRSHEFFTEYDGKLVVVGHTMTTTLPPELSSYTPEDPSDMFWAGGQVYVIDTGAGKGGFLTGFELPDARVYESRR